MLAPQHFFLSFIGQKVQKLGVKKASGRLFPTPLIVNAIETSGQ